MRKVIRLFNVTENQTSPGVWSIVFRDDSEVQELARVISGASGLKITSSTKVDQIGAWEFDVEDLELPPEDPSKGRFDELPPEVKAAEAHLHKEVNDAVWNETEAIKADQEEVIPDQDSLPLKDND